jgi:hypothetical protein
MIKKTSKQVETNNRIVNKGSKVKNRDRKLEYQEDYNKYFNNIRVI